MATPSPTYFADLSGLSQGIDARPATAVSSEALAATTGMDEFAALFLPSLFRTLFYSFSNPYDFDARWFYLIDLANGCDTCPPFARFVREHPAEARTWVSRAVTIIAEVPAFRWDEEPDVANEFLLRLATLASYIFLELINSGATAITSSLIDKVTGLKLLKVLASVKNLPSPQRVNLEGISDGGIDDELTRLELRREKEYLVWWACEAKISSSDNSVECVQGEEGQEMEACGRCLAVRYCSKKHQKLDWKRHRDLCFKPSW